MKKKSLIIATGMAVLPHMSFGLTLEEAIKEAQKRPFVESTKDYTKSAQNDLKQTRARYFPVLEISARDVLARQRTETDSNNKAASFDQTFISHRPSLRATVYQEIYNANILKRIKANKVNIKHNQDRTAMHEDEYALNTASIYVAILGAQQDIKILEKSIEQLKKISSALSNRDGGSDAKSKIDAEVSARQVALENINLDLSRLTTEFEQFTGLEAKNLEEVEFKNGVLPTNLEEAISQLKKNNKRLQYKGTQVELQKAFVDEKSVSNFIPLVRAYISAETGLNGVSDYKSSQGSDTSSNRDSQAQTLSAQIAAVWQFDLTEKYDLAKNKDLLNGLSKEYQAIMIDLISSLTDNMARVEILENKQKALMSQLDSSNQVLSATLEKINQGRTSEEIVNDAIKYSTDVAMTEKSLNQLETSRLTAAFNILSLTGELGRK